MNPWTLAIGEPMYGELQQHLFPGDGDEHAAVIAAGIVSTKRGTRLLARDLFLAQDGVDFVPGTRGYRRLTAEFVRDRIRYCRDEGLVYLAIHNHFGTDSVGFSDIDLASHERGYPALLDIAEQPVGALVLAEDALAGDIWTPDRARRPISHTVVVGTNLHVLYPEPPPPPAGMDPTYDRLVRWFGQRGRDRLSQMKVGVVGAGGVALPLVTMLARNGVGELVVIDPDRLDPTNLPRMPEARRSDVFWTLRKLPGGTRLADRVSIKKVRLAKRAARRANPEIRFKGIATNVTEHEAARELVDCDYIFLAADSHLARMVVNAVAHQYLIPAVQLGTRIDVEEETGAVGNIHLYIRSVLPGSGCLRCNKLISAAKLSDEAKDPKERARNRYVEEVPAPSVITFNTQVAAQAATDFLLSVGELIERDAWQGYLRGRPRSRVLEPWVPASNKPTCKDCSDSSTSRRARGDGVALPLPERADSRRTAWKTRLLAIFKT
jgi:molybdopterin/thiamine biosynthesis adenylyltransferase